MSPLAFMGVIAPCLVVVWVLFCIIDDHFTDRRKALNYVEYSTKAEIEILWENKADKALSWCQVCGQEDIIVSVSGMVFKARCFWCHELYYVTKHLKERATRKTLKKLEAA